LNCDASLLLLLHEVSSRSAIVHFTQLVDFTSELQDALGCSRFASVNVGEDTNISVF
jgi:hypothetical protein